MRQLWVLSAVFLFSCDDELTLGTATPVIKIEAEALDFGPVAEGREVTEGLIIKNPSEVMLSVQVELQDASADFELMTESLTVSAASEASVMVRYIPAGSGSDEGRLILRSDDPDLPEVSVPVRGGPIQPSLALAPDPLDFGAGESLARPVGLTNVGLANLHLRSIEVDPMGNQDFSLRAFELPEALPPEGAFEVVVEYSPSARANAGRLVVLSDDLEVPERILRLLPSPLRMCEDGEDNDGDGLTDFPDDPGCTSALDDSEDNPPECESGTIEMCGSDVGACMFGNRTCTSSAWGPCEGETSPQLELCDNVDNDCDGRTDEEVSEVCDINGCSGARACIENSGVMGGEWTDCIPTGGSAEICDGMDNNCNGQIDEGVIQMCTVGGCSGQQICVPEGTGEWTDCQLSPTMEVCDTIDNDCDGTPDNNIPDISCGTGACERTVSGCVMGQAENCTPGAPGVESCNGLDDDCNGAPDDLPDISCGLGVCQRTVPACAGSAPNTCTPGPSGTEVCNGLDDDCNGVPDDLLDISCGLGACMRTVAACVAGAPNTCTPGAVAAEVCNGIDDNCDGLPDNLPDLTCGVGQCLRATPACSGGSPGVCLPGQPQTEVCNNLDDDCNGTADDLPNLSCGVGACMRTVTACVGGAPNTCTQGTPGTEVCNGADDDCNGTPDDLPDISCGQGVCLRTAAACAGGAPNSCTPGTPGTETCNGLDDDCNGTADDLPDISCGVGACMRTVTACAGGVPNTCAPGPASPEVCNGIDDNCDGVIDNGVCTACGLQSAGADTYEPNEAPASSNPIVPYPGPGTNTYTYDVTLTPGDTDWMQFNFPGPIGGFAQITAEVLCSSWASAGCGGPPNVGLAMWYFDDCFPQQDDFDDGQSGLAAVSSMGPVSTLGFCGPQMFRMNVINSTTVCTGEALNAQIRVTVTLP